YSTFCGGGASRPSVGRRVTLLIWLEGMAGSPDKRSQAGLTSARWIPGSVPAVPGACDSAPRRTGQHVKRNLEVTAAVCLRFGQTSSIGIDLQRMQDKPWHGKGPVARLAGGDELVLRPVFREMDVLCLLFGHGRLPQGFPAARLVVMSRKEAGVVRQGENGLDRPPQFSRIAAGEIGPRRGLTP